MSKSIWTWGAKNGGGIVWSNVRGAIHVGILLISFLCLIPHLVGLIFSSGFFHDCCDGTMDNLKAFLESHGILSKNQKIMGKNPTSWESTTSTHLLAHLINNVRKVCNEKEGLGMHFLWKIPLRGKYY